jgi:hypothetical protein
LYSKTERASDMHNTREVSLKSYQQFDPFLAPAAVNAEQA